MTWYAMAEPRLTPDEAAYVNELVEGYMVMTLADFTARFKPENQIACACIGGIRPPPGYSSQRPCYCRLAVIAEVRALARCHLVHRPKETS